MHEIVGQPRDAGPQDVRPEATAGVTTAASAPPVSQAADARPPWLLVILAPWFGVFTPGAVGRTLARASTAAFVVAFVLGLLVTAGVISGLTLWEGTITIRILPVRTATAPGFEWYERSVADVWADWHAQSWFGPAEQVVVATILLGALFYAFMAWLILMRIHRSGAAWRSYTRALRLSFAIAGWMTGGIFVFAGLFVAYDHSRFGLTGIFNYVARQVFDELHVAPEMVVAVLSGPAACGVLLWLGRAMRAGSFPEPVLDLPPVCEGCGYNLTHQPADARCPECGTAIARSLGDATLRRGIDWERRPSIGHWLATFRGAFRHPHAFYQALRLRTSDRTAVVFERWNFVLLGVVGGVWGFFVTLAEQLVHGAQWGSAGVSYTQALIPAIILLTWTPWVCWVGHRTIAALAVTWWLIRGALPDYRWASKVVAYESVWLWVFCTYWGAWITSLMLFGPWLSEALRPRFLRLPFYLPPEIAAMIGGTALLAAAWLYRYVVALRAIRWSNS